MTTHHDIRTIARRWGRNKWVLASVGVAVLALLFVLIRPSRKESDAHQAFYSVKRGDFLVSVVEGGTIKAVREVTVRCELEGASRITSIVPEGSYVKKGELLVELDSSDL